MGNVNFVDAASSDGGAATLPLTAINTKNQYGTWSGNTSTSSLDSTGILNVATIIDTSSTAVTDSGGRYFQQSTSTSASGFCYCQTNPTFRLAHKPYTLFKFQINQTSGTRFYFVCSASAASGFILFDNPSADYYGLTFSDPRGDTNFQFVHRDNPTAQTLIDTGEAPVTNRPYFFEADATASDNIVMKLYDDTFTELASTTVTSNIPASTSNLYTFVSTVHDAGGSAHSHRIYSCYHKLRIVEE